jgi:hypothetical protein
MFENKPKISLQRLKQEWPVFKIIFIKIVIKIKMKEWPVFNKVQNVNFFLIHHLKNGVSHIIITHKTCPVYLFL